MLSPTRGCSRLCSSTIVQLDGVLACSRSWLGDRSDHGDNSRRDLPTGARERHPSFRRGDVCRWIALGGTVFIAKPDSAEVLIGPGILEAFVGTVLWFIGRPDRP